MNLQDILAAHAAWLRGEADGKRADLRRADLEGATLTGVDLRRAVMTGVDLRRADLRRAVLWGADLRGADLRCADLEGATLAGADLRRADLRRATLTGATLTGATLTGARGLYELDMTDPRGYRPVAVAHPDGWRIASGCRWFTVPEAVAHWSGRDHKYAARYLRAISELPECPA